jgi:hypothetical protein
MRAIANSRAAVRQDHPSFIFKKDNENLILSAHKAF